MQSLYIVIAGFNIFGFFLMGWDKYKAKRGGWRVPEANLFFVALIGGALGVLLGMRAFRHKTKHYAFVIGVPVIFVLNVVSVYLLTNSNQLP